MSTYSTNLALELIANGDQSGTWGDTTNTNLGTLIEQAISGYVTQACTGGTDTITIPNGTTGVARNMFLELTGTGGGTLVVPTNKKLYFVFNNTSTAITVKVSGLTGVSVPAGKKTILVSNGTDIIDATNYVTALAAGTLSLTTALSAANGGTGLTSPGTAGNILTSTGSGWQSSAASTFVSSVSATSPLSSTGGNTPTLSIGSTIPVTLGGTGVASATAYALLAGGTTSTGAVQSIASVGTSGQILTSNGAGALPTFQTATVASPVATSVYKTTAGSGTFTIPSGITTVKVTVVGGGGGGARSASGAGGGGGTAIKTLTGLTPGNTLSYYVGYTQTNAEDNNSTVSSGTQSISTITGGGGVRPGDSSNTGAAGGTASGGDFNVNGQSGQSYDPGSGVGGVGGNSLYGYGGGGPYPFINAQGYGGGGGPVNGYGSGGVIIFEY
jgi:hypothetical protein